MSDTQDTLIEQLNPDMPAQEMRLYMGEMTAQEMRTARAAIRWANSKAEAQVAELTQKLERAEQAVAFVARWAWRTDPPNGNRKMSDGERLSCIKLHPVIKKAAAPHIELAKQEARALNSGASQNG